MKKLLYLLTLTTLCLSLTSCGGEDEDPNSIVTPPSTNLQQEQIGSSLPESTQKFFGTWYCNVGSNSTYTFSFYPNGKAMRSYFVDNIYYPYDWGKVMGKWLYNEEKSLLATTIDMWSFNINASFNDSWVGSTVNTGKSVNASLAPDSVFLLHYVQAAVKFENETKEPINLRNGSQATGNFETSTYADVLSFEGVTIDENKITATAVITRKRRGYQVDETNIEKCPVIISKPFSDNPIMTLSENGTHFEIKMDYDTREYISTTYAVNLEQSTKFKPGTFNGTWN